MDEIFGRSNFISSIAVRSSTPSGVKTAHKEKTIIKQKDIILVYRKTEHVRFTPIYIRKNEWDTHFNYYVDRTNNKVYSFVDILRKNKIIGSNQTLKDFSIDNKSHREFYIKYADSICQTQSHKNENIKNISRNKIDEIIFINEGLENEQMFYNGRQLTPLSKSLNEVLYNGSIEYDISILLCDFWQDIDFQNTQNEGSVDFPTSKKPEGILYRILKMCTSEGDLVLDSFLGSGSTAAVAHKMKRKWIGIELGEHAVSHCSPRLINVVNGEKSGISKTLNWQGGGGFKFYTLAPSLLNQDKFGNWVISQEYNAQMLAAAMAKQEGFSFQPDDTKYWKQGKSSEQDYIFTTTQFLSRALLDSIADDLLSEESLLICCAQFEAGLENAYPNINLRKIPAMLLNRCEFKQDSDYSLNIINSPLDELRPEIGERIKPEAAKIKDNPKHTTQMPDLFNHTTNE
jgi:adenine-specific DNA-methyltransferase